MRDTLMVVVIEWECPACHGVSSCGSCLDGYCDLTVDAWWNPPGSLTPEPVTEALLDDRWDDYILFLREWVVTTGFIPESGDACKYTVRAKEPGEYTDPLGLMEDH
jgi:hypothetical protein